MNKSRIMDLLILSSASWFLLVALLSTLLDHAEELKPISMDWIPITIGTLTIAAMAAVSTIAVYRSLK